MPSDKSARRHALAEAQNWRCAHCGKAMLRESGHDNSATIEHVIPLGVGGYRTWGNEVAAHARCNFARGINALDKVSVDIARELMDREMSGVGPGAVRRAEESLSIIKEQLHEVRELLEGIPSGSIAANSILRTVNAMIQSGSPIPAEFKFQPTATLWCRAYRSRMKGRTARFWARLKLVVRAVASAWSAGLSDAPVDVRIVRRGKAGTIAPQTEWQILFGPAWADHLGRRPKHYSRDRWYREFFDVFPDALTHPGCPAGGRPKTPPGSVVAPAAPKWEGQIREPGYDQA